MSNADSIKAKLKKIAIEEDKPFDYLLMHYLIERLLYRLSISKYSNNFILKGGLLLYTIFENDARATKDIDFLARQINNIPEELSGAFSEIASIQVDDSVRFDPDTITVERIKEDADYQGVRIKLTGYLDKSRHILQFDIGFGDVIVPKPVDMEYPSLLDMERPRLKAYSLESVIAEKFQAMIYLAESNSRMKDFYDIYKLSHSFDFEGRTLYEAVSQTLERRATPLTRTPTVFSDAFPNLNDKPTQWRAFQRRIGVAGGVDFALIIADIKSFLLPLYNSILSENEFFGHWNHVNAEWTENLTAH